MTPRKPHSLKDQLLYRIDNSLSRGTVNIILWLTVILILIVVAMALLVWLTGTSREQTLARQIWMFVAAVFPKYKPIDEHLIYIFATLILFITSLFVSGALISALTTGLSSKLEQVREGHSKVVETGHTVILGWSPHIVSIITELIIANQNQRHSSIVVLGDIPRYEMLIYIKKYIKQFGGTRIICRQGDRRSVTDLQQLSLETSKSIIINQHYQALSDVPKTLLAINKSRRQRFRELHVVAIVESEEDAELCNIIGGNEVEIIHAKYFLARLEAQTCRQRGLPHVYTELLNFAGDEIYIQEENALVGRNYIEIIKSYHSSSVIGIYDSSDKINLNPSMDTALESGDKIIAISEDDDTVKLAKGNGFEKITSIVNTSYQNKKDVENFLILGLNSQTLIMLKNLDEYVPAGSSVTIISEFECFDKDTYKNFDNLKIDIKQADFRERKYLDTIQYQNFDSVIVQGNDKVEIEEADAMTISTLVHLRDLRKKNDGNFPIITEFFDGKNSELVESVKLDDFIISDSILSMAVAQVSENKLLGEVFRELFQPEGSEIYLKPAGNYVHLDQTINFFTLIDSAANKGETAIGYRMNEFANTPSRFVGFKEMTYGVIINPEKNDTFKLNSYDSVIVLSEM